MTSTVCYMGKIASYQQIGMPYVFVKQALMADGVPAMMADALIKEAGVASWIGKGLEWAGSHLSGLSTGLGMKQLGRGMTEAAAGAAKPGMLTNAMGWGSKQLGRMGGAVGGAGTGLTNAAATGTMGKFMSGGAQNYGRGLLMGGQGLSGGLGRATTGGMAAYGGYRMLGGGGQPQQQQQQPMQRPMGR